MKQKSLSRMAGEVIWYAVVFLIIHLVAIGVTSVAEKLIAGYDMRTVLANGGTAINDISATALIVSSIISSLIAIAIFLKTKWTPWSRDYIATRPWGIVFWIIILAFGLIIPSLWMQERLNLEMPKDMEQMFNDMLRSPYGYFTIAILSPWAEEVVFRGAILRKLLQIFSRQMHWVAIVISALIFGAAHMNLAQGVNAAFIGLLLGWLYYRTGSIFPGMVFHWANNSIAYIISRLRPDLNDMTLTELCGGDDRQVLMYIGFSLLIILPALFQLAIRLKRTK